MPQPWHQKEPRCCCDLHGAVCTARTLPKLGAMQTCALRPASLPLPINDSPGAIQHFLLEAPENPHQQPLCKSETTYITLSKP